MAFQPTGARTPIRVVLIDDHEVVRACVRDLLEVSGGITVVGEDGSAATAAATILTAHADVAVVDLRLGDGSGIEVCREVARHDPRVATLLLTADDDEQAGVATVLAGARGYALKLVRGARLVEAVRELTDTPDFLDSDGGRRALAWLARERGRDATRLDAQEARALALVCEGRTDQQIAEQMAIPVAEVVDLVSAVLVELGFPSAIRPSGDGSRRDHPSWRLSTRT